MAKRLQKNRALGKILDTNALELNRWCIEMAMRWPVHEDHFGASGAYGGMSQFPKTTSRSDADVIGRAGKLFTWITTPR